MLHVRFLCIHAQDENGVNDDETDGTTSKNDKKPEPVKHEVVEAAEPVEDAESTPELPTAGKGSSAHKDLFSAVLHQLVASDKVPSHWMATIEYGNPGVPCFCFSEAFFGLSKCFCFSEAF